MKYIWEPTDIRPGKRLFLKRMDVSKVSIGQLEHVTTDCSFVIINEGVVSEARTADDMANFLNENGSVPE